MGLGLERRDVDLLDLPVLFASGTTTWLGGPTLLGPSAEMECAQHGYAKSQSVHKQALHLGAIKSTKEAEIIKTSTATKKTR